MKESEQPNNVEIKNNETIIYNQEDIDRIFDKITEKTETFTIENINPKYGLKKRKENEIYFNLNNHVLKGSMDLSLLPKKLPHLKLLKLWHVPLKSLKGLPSELSSLEIIDIAHCPLESLKYIPNSLPNLKRIVVFSSNIISLNNFPGNVPNLKDIWLHHNQITSLKGLPPELPKLNYFSLTHNNLTTLKYLPKLNTCRIWIKGNPLRSFFNLNEGLFNKLIKDSSEWKSFDLSPRGIQLLNEYRVPIIDEKNLNGISLVYADILPKIKKFYSKPLSEITQKYVEYPNNLTDDELDRLVWEADLEDRNFLESYLPKDDPILREINQRFSIKMKSNFTLLI